MVDVFTRITNELFQMLKEDAYNNFMSVSRTIFLRLLLSCREHPTLEDVIKELKKNGDLSSL